jgi:hypothetical protein
MTDTFHFPVNQLIVPTTLTLGRVRFRPKGWLSAMLNAAPRADDTVNGWAQLHEELKREARELRSSTADVEADDENSARDLVSDAVAALRVYQRLRYPMVNLEHQTFGLTADIHRTREDYWRITTDGLLAGAGGSWHGVYGEWEFSAADVDASSSDPAFVQLVHLVTIDSGEATEVDRRLLTALRLSNRSTAMLPASLRVVQLATALEALLGDEPPAGRPHRVALRAAYLTCESGQGFHSPARPCPYFGCRTLSQLKRAMKKAAADGRGYFCSAYWDVRELQELRNSILHEAVTNVDRPRASERQVDEVLTHVLRWRREGPGRDTLADLDRDMAAAATSW